MEEKKELTEAAPEAQQGIEEQGLSEELKRLVGILFSNSKKAEA